MVSADLSRKRVEQLMRRQVCKGAVAVQALANCCFDKQNPARAAPVPDLFNLEFIAAAPNRPWVTHATRISCGQW